MSESPQRSQFVTALAWTFIAFSGFAAAASILQSILVHTIFDRPEFQQAMQKIPPGAPPFTAFVMSHLDLLFIACLLMSVCMFISAIGLLKRRNWARLCIIGFMALAIAWQFAGTGYQIAMFSSMREQFSAAKAQGVPDMSPMLVPMAIFGAIWALGFIVLFGWIIRKLVSAPIAAEFRS